MTTPKLEVGGHLPGLVARTITRLFMRTTRVTHVNSLSASFRLIGLQSADLKDVVWLPGEKVQVKLGKALSTRTYTPLMWDQVEGTTELLVYCHGGGPGSEWAKSVVTGDEQHVLGPRRALDLVDIAESTILFGDETSFALAVALERCKRTAKRRFVLEVDDLDECASVAGKLGLTETVLIQRRANDAHRQEISDAILGRAQSTTNFVLSGKASSIQRVRRTLKEAGIEARRFLTKAHWAPGKVGLD